MTRPMPHGPLRRRLRLLIGVSALALLGAGALPLPGLAQMGGGSQGNAQDIDPDGGMGNECGEASGCAEAGESIESRTNDEMGEDDDDHSVPPPVARPRSQGGGLGDGDSVTGTLHDGGLGE